MSTQIGLSFEFSRGGELIIRFPEEPPYHTGLRPSADEREKTKAFFETTIGRTLIMNLRLAEIHDKRTRLLLQEPARSLIEHNIKSLHNKRFSGIVTVLMLDLDHFGRVNKQYGNDAGDRVLEWFAEIMRKSTRTGDILSRWGGEEFVIFAAANSPQTEQSNRDRDKSTEIQARISTGTTLTNLGDLMNHGKLIGKRIRDTAANTLCQADQNLITQTVTIGVANAYLHPSLDPNGLFDTLFKRAMNAMYDAKEAGKRNDIHITELYRPPSL